MAMMLPFIKMHGLGNDFVVFILSQLPDGFAMTPELCQNLSNRKTGIGCDQIIVMDDETDDDGAYTIAFYNSDGSFSGACGNGTRCIAGLLFEELDEIAVEHELPPLDRLTLRVKGYGATGDRLLQAYRAEGGLVTVNMGKPVLHADLIPVKSNTPQTLSFPEMPLPVGTAVSMGNPHCVFFVDNEYRDHLALQWGEAVENHAVFPQRTNVEFVSILNKENLAKTVWERGAGITQACGTGACAALVAAHLNGYTGRSANVHLAGGTLHILWDEQSGDIYKTGAYTWVAEGIFAWNEE